MIKYPNRFLPLKLIIKNVNVCSVFRYFIQEERLIAFYKTTVIDKYM